MRAKKAQEKQKYYSLALVAHVYNPSYSGGRDQEGQGSKPPQANTSPDSHLKKKKKTTLKQGW
jgi:hypothetical protein